MTVTVNQLLSHAAAQLGTYERTGRNDVLYADYWGITGYAWCYAYVQWCFDSLNTRLPFVTMYVPAGVAWSRHNVQAVERGQPPIPGDIVHFTWDMNVWPPDRAGTGDHVGLVERVEGDTIITLEGNVGSPQGVWRMRRSISATVVNFWRPVGIYSDGLPPVTPSPAEEEDEDMGVLIGSDPSQGGDGSVYGVWGPEAWAFASEETLNLYVQFGLVKPGTKWMHPANIQRLIIRGVIDADHFNLQNPYPSNADVAGAVNAGRNESAQNHNATRVSSTADAAAVMQNSNKLAAGIVTGGGQPGMTLEQALQQATVKQLLDRLSAITGK